LQVRRKKLPNYWRCMTVIQLGSQTKCDRDSVVTVLSHHSRARGRSSSAKLNFRLSVAGDVPQTTIRVLVVESASCCPLHVLHFEKYTLSYCLAFLAWLDSRGYLGEEYLCVPRRSLFLATPPAKRLKSQREGQHPVSYS